MYSDTSSYTMKNQPPFLNKDFHSFKFPAWPMPKKNPENGASEKRRPAHEKTAEIERLWLTKARSKTQVFRFSRAGP